jgi:hypothetical protein
MKHICMHVSHKTEFGRFNFPPVKGKSWSEKIELTMGWNPIHKRLEICDKGFIVPKKKKVYYVEEPSNW